MRLSCRIVFLLSVLAFPLAAENTLRVSTGPAYSYISPSVTEHLFYDDLLNGGGLGVLDGPWEKRPAWVFPLSAEYRHTLGPGVIFLGAEGAESRPRFTYDSFGLSFGTRTHLKDFKMQDLESRLGYDISFMDDKFSIGPWMGWRFHGTEYTTSFITLGQNIVSTNIQSRMRDGAMGGMWGIRGRFRLKEDLSIIGGIAEDGPARGLRGAMKEQRLTAGAALNAPFVSYDQINALTVLNIVRISAGAELDLSERLHLRLVLSDERMTVSHPGYQDIPVTAVNGALIFPVFLPELGLDRAIWEKGESQRNVRLESALSYDLQW